jgi:hypothetical protein
MGIPCIPGFMLKGILEVADAQESSQIELLFVAIESQDEDFLFSFSNESLQEMTLSPEKLVQKLPSLLEHLSKDVSLAVAYKTAWILRKLIFAAFQQDHRELAGKEPNNLQEILKKVQHLHSAVAFELHLIQQLFHESTTSAYPNLYHFFETSCAILQRTGLSDMRTLSENEKNLLETCHQVVQLQSHLLEQREILLQKENKRLAQEQGEMPQAVKKLRFDPTTITLQRFAQQVFELHDQQKLKECRQNTLDELFAEHDVIPLIESHVNLPATHQDIERILDSMSQKLYHSLEKRASAQGNEQENESSFRLQSTPKQVPSQEQVNRTNDSSEIPQRILSPPVATPPSDLNAYDYNHLAMTTPAKLDRIQLPDGTSMTRQQLYLKVIDLDPNFPNGYYELAVTLPRGGSIRLLNGTTMTQQQLYLQTIKLNPGYAYAYYDLANTLPKGESIRLLNGTTMTQQQLYLKAIEFNSNFTNAYYELAMNLPSEKSIQIPNIGNMTKKQLYLRVIELRPDFAEAYYELAHQLLQGHWTQIPNIGNVSQQQLLLKAIALKPNLAKAYLALAYTLRGRESIQIPNIGNLTQLHLLGKYEELKKQS